MVIMWRSAKVMSGCNARFAMEAFHMSDWKTEFKEHLLSGNIKQADEIKNKHVNRHFYIYRSFNADRFWVDWAKGKIRAGSPKKFNDPFDCLLTITKETNKKVMIDNLKITLSQFVKLSKIDISRLELSDDPREALHTILKQRGKKIDRATIDANLDFESAAERIDHFFREICKITCFSEKNDSILMWSHYSKNHQGFCIEYDFSNHPEISKLLYPVIYDEKRAILLPHHIEREEWHLFSILCKALEWKYESEWRYVNAVNPKKRKDVDEAIVLTAPDTIKTIYLGVDATKYNSDSVAELKGIAKGLNIQVYEMQFDDSSYRLTVKR